MIIFSIRVKRRNVEYNFNSTIARCSKSHHPQVGWWASSLFRGASPFSQIIQDTIYFIQSLINTIQYTTLS